MTGKSVYVTTDYREKQLQRALLQFSKPENANLVREALRIAGREDLIGNGPSCLVRAAFGQGGKTQYTPRKSTARAGKTAKRREKPRKIKGSRNTVAKGAVKSARSTGAVKRKRG